MAPMTAAERQRKYREKLKNENPEKLDRLKKENAERTKKRYKKIDQLPEPEQNEQRKKWRRQKQNNKEESTNQSEASQLAEVKEKRKFRYRLSKENKQLKNSIQEMSKIIKAQRKTLYRYKKQIELLKQSLYNTEQNFEQLRGLNGNHNLEANTNASTPFSKTEKFLEETIPNVSNVDKEKVKKAIFESYVLKESLSSQYSNSKTQSEKNVLKNVINNDIVRKYKLKTDLSNSCLGLKGRLRENKRALETKKTKRIKEIRSFLERDDNSRMTAGKRETKTLKRDKRQVRYLQDSLEKLHKKYMDEGGTASYSTFTKYKPFYILDPKLSQRNTCACVKHANLSFVAQKLKILGVINTDDLEELVSAIVCDKFNKQCMYGECTSCKNKTVSFNLAEKTMDAMVFWYAWVTKTHEYIEKNENKKITKRTSKTVIHDTLATLIKSFTDQLLKFKKHYFNIYHAYQMYKKCKETLSESECIIHCDFSENYLAKMSEEVQATHFGASKQQFTLHTGVIYFKNEQILEEKSFCTISPNNNHSPVAIWAHLTPILEYIKQKCQNIKTIHFFSDGPTTQYRQKGNFYLMTKMIKKLGFEKSTWSFFESAHGKGAADGIGGAVKRTLDKKVTYGEDIVDARTAYDVLVKCQSKILYFYISDEDIKTIQGVDLTGLIPVPRTMEIHQVISTEEADVIKYRLLACFCGAPLCLCYGLEEHNLKVKKLKRKYKIEKTETKKRPNRRTCVENYDSDTTEEDLEVTYAESDNSLWDPEESKLEYSEEDEHVNENNSGTISNEHILSKTDIAAKCPNKRITLLSDIKNTPENYKYFDLNNYGPFKLHKINKIQISPSTSGVKRRDSKKAVKKENEVGIEDKCCISVKQREIKEVATKENENATEDVCVMSVKRGETKEVAMQENKNAIENECFMVVQRCDIKEAAMKGNKDAIEDECVKSVKREDIKEVMVKENKDVIKVEYAMNVKQIKEAAMKENKDAIGSKYVMSVKQGGNKETAIKETNDTKEDECVMSVKQGYIKKATKKDNRDAIEDECVMIVKVGDVKEDMMKENKDVIKGKYVMSVKQEVIKETVINETKVAIENECVMRSYAECAGLANIESLKRNETTKEKILNDDFIYNINDSVLVRYFEKKKSWVYYIGFIEGIIKKAHETYYNVRFLKTVKIPQLKFVTPKKIDRDTIPTGCVVKYINLKYHSNEYMLKDECDDTYFL